MDKFSDNRQCFVCGSGNPHGLKLSFRYVREKDHVEAEVTFPAHLQGWDGVVHGGLVSTVLDEIMVKAAEVKKIKCVTGEITVRFKKPTLTGETYTLRGKVIEADRRIVLTEADLSDCDGRVKATCKGKLFIVD